MKACSAFGSVSVVFALLLSACGGTSRTVAPTPPNSAPKPARPSQPIEANTAAIPSFDVGAPNPAGRPSFVVEGHAANGDKIRIEGRFGPVLPANESGVDQSVLSGCPLYNGREFLTRVDLTTTIESNLPASVELKGFRLSSPEAAEGQRAPWEDYVYDVSEGQKCEGDGSDNGGEENEPGFNLGTLQPHEAKNSTMWVVLLNAFTPNHPEPSLATLTHEGQQIGEGWQMGEPAPIMAGAEVGMTYASWHHIENNLGIYESRPIPLSMMARNHDPASWRNGKYMVELTKCSVNSSGQAEALVHVTGVSSYMAVIDFYGTEGKFQGREYAVSTGASQSNESPAKYTGSSGGVICHLVSVQGEPGAVPIYVEPGGTLARGSKAMPPAPSLSYVGPPAGLNLRGEGESRGEGQP